MSKDKVTTATVKQMKAEGRPITMLTAYDFSMAKLVDDAGIDMILVGDSLGNVMLGYESTLPVTMDEMIHHVKAVCRGTSRAMVVADLPFMSYQVSVKEALRNSGRFLKETTASAVKLEGGQEVFDVIRAVVDAGIPVVGHLGLTPQSVHQMGGYKVQGKDEAAARKLLADAKCVEEAGAFCLVLECVPAPLAKLVTESLQIPTIGIGAGAQCDGQVLVIHDMLGLYPRSSPKFVKKYVNLHEHMTAALKQYIEEVTERSFPGPEHSFGMSEEVLKKLY
ncbi:3-methyl-2-oxobutanoate hydroxymethyltransferase [Pelotomaculum propionicicum]|uniref:3-methyl-2-oxobutanoate hydroxymethyltransferase n=1 Tax=Pelotomaculum propionicicum TaxID=258475 RepID=A0A4Y7RP52_9FIRM|nr:3-methyl-2-oxobutanoate hydroxymethyltransferase [Pelotomaculum propionicicum]NLI12323.1 3-methyl-2-oxobutanoate hydroxymethyltransferase [Peptococcaceae bacterium]TEB10452.1 3-methyl-2-oxobutanoate hydroxymethyltransferase [Pelotomaculum propionicicum]